MREGGTRRSSAVAVSVWLCLAGAALFGAAEPARSAAAPPSGLVIVRDVTNSATDDQNLTTTGLANPDVSGVAVQIGWRDIEPKPEAEATPNWTTLDAMFQAAQSRHKWVALLVFAGFYAPPWAYPSPAPMFTPQYGPLLEEMQRKHDVHAIPMPLPWDQTYLANWFAFLKLVEARYSPYDNFRMIAADGPSSVSVEMTMPGTHPRAALERWIDLGYTPETYENAYDAVFRQYQTLFKDQYVVLTVGDALHISCSTGKKGATSCRPTPDSGAVTRLAIIGDAMTTFGSRFVLQNSNLTPADPTRDLQFVMTYAGATTTGLQMKTTFTADDLRDAIAFGTRPNDRGCRVNYLEIYQGDVVDKDGSVNTTTQAALRDGASVTSSQLPTCRAGPIGLPSIRPPHIVPSGTQPF